MTNSRAKKNMVGVKYSLLLIIKEIKKRNKNGHIMYLCLCDCGNNKEILGSSIRSGSTTSCGCVHKKAITKHGKDGTSIYKTWIGMKSRCDNIGDYRYKNWGGRGIKVCKRWYDFTLFLQDMGEKPKNTSIDRIDNEKGYYPENCKWSTAKEQARNRRNTIMVNHNGVDMYMDDFAKNINLSESGARKKVGREFTKIDGIFVKESDLIKEL